ncbi:hypothetical protein ES702_04249 [subsurface metagenome]
MSPYEPRERKSQEVPVVCPLLKTCRQRMEDLEEYERLKTKWTKHAQEALEEGPEKVKAHRTRILTEKGFASRKRKLTVDWVQDVTGPQVFYLEYKKPDEAKERLAKMCPHVKREALGLFTKEPPYFECQTFSEWYYQKGRE